MSESSLTKSIPVAFPRGDLVIRGEQWPADAHQGDVLLLHGGGQTRHSWQGTARWLAQLGWSATSIDLRGHGESDWDPAGRYGLELHALDVAAVARELSKNRVLVGASLGGLASLSAQAAHPDLARALVLVDIVPRTAERGKDRILKFMTDHPSGFGSLDEVADVVAAYTRRARKRDLDSLRKNVRLRDDGRWYWHWDPRIVPPQHEIDQNPAIDPDSLQAQARSITVPVLVVRGGDSDIVDDSGLREFQSALPRCTVVEVPGAGHMVAGDDNDAFTRAIADFLDALG
jgi:pimeloyl-ACP methyl ester carboxylesterase